MKEFVVEISVPMMAIIIQKLMPDVDVQIMDIVIQKLKMDFAVLKMMKVSGKDGAKSVGKKAI